MSNQFIEFELEQAEYRLERGDCILQILEKYSDSATEKLPAIEARMTPADRAIYDAAWNGLGNVLVGWDYCGGANDVT